jgi:hypothetical protein
MFVCADGKLDFYAAFNPEKNRAGVCEFAKQGAGEPLEEA